MLPFVAVSLMVVFGSLSLLRKEELSSNAVHLRSHHPEEMKALVPNGAVHAPAEGSDASLAQESWAPKGESTLGAGAEFSSVTTMVAAACLSFSTQTAFQTAYESTRVSTV